MKITTLEIAGFASAIKGMRNPMNSWDKSDSFYVTYDGKNASKYEGQPYLFKIGEADMELAKRLVRAGSEHGKFLRQIQIWADFDMPRYWWSEFDTYHFNTKNSCSTMHRLLNTKKEITRDDFTTCDEDLDIIDRIIARLNTLRVEYTVMGASQERKNYLLLRAKRLLPEGYLQLRTVNTNYAELMNIYHQRKHHRLKEEWVDVFCKWCESLPYFKELCIDTHKERK